ncbi:RagB/SusD family nutrient uptake outer membrane protein [Pedobacter aquatilis]|uniref:RagB/SusD family nutrient uptake outer membrane protein n=1 Tax=Pedobacter aquatilis TaxID=351343 RepID=UPI0029306F6F|nr:RagB/SusD family nutrient uptake outer membrane protein [Pedobacter aquatilis]
MRKNIFIVFVGLISLSACKKDFLEQTDPNAVTVDQFFTSPNDVLLAVNGAYQSLRSGNNIGETSSLYTEQRSDNTGTNDNQSNAGEPFQFGDFSILPSNTYLKSHWVSLYTTITRCNVITSNIDKVTFTNADLKAQYLAETKFIRGLTYFHLVRKWGDIPLVTKQLTSNDEVVANTYRQPQATVYAQIVTDLREALNSNLSNLATGANAGRVSKAAINALLGQVYLTMATTLDANKTENLANANTYLLAAYNMKSFTTLAAIPYADVFDVTKKSNNPEVIFEIVNIQGNITYASSIAANNQAFGETINSRRAPTGVGGNVTPDLVLDYETGDPRKDFSIKYAADTRVLDWFITKYRDASEAATVNGYGGNNFPLIRFADVILMLAEINMLQGNNAAAIQYLDMVRARAGVPLYAVASTNATYASKYPTLKLAILHERRVELAFENHRWFDLLRNFTTAELVTYFRGKTQANFGNARLTNFTTKDRYYPIPFDEYKLDPAKMYQNPGY